MLECPGHMAVGITMKIELSKSQFKPRVLEYLREVQQTGRSIVITDHGRPVVEVRRYLPEGSDPLERLRGSVRRYEAPFEPVGEEDWEADL